MDKIFDLQYKVLEIKEDETIMLDNPDDFSKEIYDYLEKIKWLRPEFTNNIYVKQQMKSADKGFYINVDNNYIGIKYKKEYGEKDPVLKNFDTNLLVSFFSYTDGENYLRELTSLVSYDYSSKEFEILNVSCKEITEISSKSYYWFGKEEKLKTK